MASHVEGAMWVTTGAANKKDNEVEAAPSTVTCSSIDPVMGPGGATHVTALSASWSITLTPEHGCSPMRTVMPSKKF